jgi:hypothetical protein
MKIKFERKIVTSGSSGTGSTTAKLFHADDIVTGKNPATFELARASSSDRGAPGDYNCLEGRNMTQRVSDGGKTKRAASIIAWVSMLAMVGLATVPAHAKHVGGSANHSGSATAALPPQPARGTRHGDGGQPG